MSSTAPSPGSRSLTTSTPVAAALGPTLFAGGGASVRAERAAPRCGDAGGRGATRRSRGGERGRGRRGLAHVQEIGDDVGEPEHVAVEGDGAGAGDLSGEAAVLEDLKGGSMGAKPTRTQVADRRDLDIEPREKVLFAGRAPPAR